MGEYLLGIDIGTSACKIAVFAKDGTVRATGTGDYQVYYPYPGWAEQNPEEWWEAVCDAIPRVLVKGNISPEEIKGKKQYRKQILSRMRSRELESMGRAGLQSQ